MLCIVSKGKVIRAWQTIGWVVDVIILQIKDIEDCFDGTYIKEIMFDAEMEKDLVFYLGRKGKIYYYEEFPRPFFKIHMKGEYDIKGIVGENTLRIHLTDPQNYGIEDFIQYINEFLPQS